MIRLVHYWIKQPPLLQTGYHVHPRNRLLGYPNRRLLRQLASLIPRLLYPQLSFMPTSGAQSVSSRPSIQQPSVITCLSNMGCLSGTLRCQELRSSDSRSTLWQECQRVAIAGAHLPESHNSETTSSRRCARFCTERRPRDYGQQPALPEGESTESMPLKDRASTAVHLEAGGWRALASSPGFQQVALSHCPLCHLWVANASGQVKKHITLKHKEHAEVVKRVIEECRKDTTDLVSPCPLCSRDWKGPKIRHRESCTVLFAARLVAALHQPSSPAPPARASSDHDAQITSHRVRGDLQQHVSDSGGRAEEGEARLDGGSDGNEWSIFRSRQGQRQRERAKRAATAAEAGVEPCHSRCRHIRDRCNPILRDTGT